jgi:hypothetical protein
MVNKHQSHEDAMFTKTLSTASKLGRSKLDKAIVLSVAAMLAMNLFVLTQQHGAPGLAAATVAAATVQA